ncbi:solute carrier family 22 member 6-B-like isoform X4 [Dermacentor albipictus]|uniref:solute carrier family 22 member 6-B-like isoform X4 n=1 Tax=Dermacentor albipictus TaxID=60249 RepID=UPI0031FD6268
MEAASGMASQVNTPEESADTPLEDNLSAIIGRTGFFHRSLFSYEMVAMMCLTLHNIVHGESASDADHWCRLPDPPANMTLEEWRDANIPREENGTLSRCLVYSVPVGERPAENATRVAVPCSDRVFNVSANVKLSVIKQWDLTCDRKWMASACETVYTVGSIIGLMLSGLSADRIGRKPTICFSAVVLEVVGISLSSVGSVFLFTCHRFLVGAAIHALVYTQYIMLVEVVATQWRAMYMTFVIYGYLIGFLIKVFTLGDDIDWRNQQLIVMLPTTVLLCGFFLLPESPRWSLTNLRVEEAVRGVAYILRCNRATPDAIKAVIKKLRLEPLQTLHRRMSANEEASQYLSHRRTQAHELVSPEKTVWELLVILITQYQFSSLTISFCWFACSISFYGLALDLKVGSIDSWFQFALVAASPMATYVLVVWLGRRDVLAVSLYIVCISCITAAFLPRGSTSIRFVTLSSAWFFSNVAYTVLFVYATEIYPTVVRALSFNLGAGLGRIGTIIAPYLYHGAGSKFGSYLLLAFTCGLSGFLVGKLPDTKEVHLPELIKPEENLFDFSPLRQHISRSRGGMGLSLHDTSSNGSLLVPALLKVPTSKLVLSELDPAMASTSAAGCRVGSSVLYGLVCVVAFSACVIGHDHGHSHSSEPSKSVRFRERWDATDVVRDVEHIKEDLAALVDLKNTGELTEEEITFYFFRMHDFDGNTMLDGIELLSAMQHTFDHGFAPAGLGQQSFDDMIKLVDGALMLDANNDGFVSYPELRITLDKK